MKNKSSVINDIEEKLDSVNKGIDAYALLVEMCIRAINFNSNQKIDIYGQKIPVINKEDKKKYEKLLVDYKQRLEELKEEKKIIQNDIYTSADL